MSLRSKPNKKPTEEVVWFDAKGNMHVGEEPKNNILPKIEHVTDKDEMVYIIDGDWVSRDSGEMVNKEDIENKIIRLTNSLTTIEDKLRLEPNTIRDFHLKGYNDIFIEIEKINDPSALALKQRMNKIRDELRQLK